jgi:threonine dehydrogenase-like Zn-dependent dehydrogenase
LGKQETFENALRSLRPGGTLSSVGVYSGHLKMPVEAIHSGLGDQTVVTTLCPGGKERMQRLMRTGDRRPDQSDTAANASVFVRRNRQSVRVVRIAT